ncbi:MAG: hypothetical protein RLN62_01025 [Rickettsiales bacterium]
MKTKNEKLIKRINEIKQKNLKTYYKLNYLNEIIHDKHLNSSTISNNDLVDLIYYFKNFYQINIIQITLKQITSSKPLNKNYHSYSLEIGLKARNEPNIISFLLALDSNLKGINLFEHININKQGNLYSASTRILFFVPSEIDNLETDTFNKQSKFRKQQKTKSNDFITTYWY